jgi:hemolysin D
VEPSPSPATARCRTRSRCVGRRVEQLFQRRSRVNVPSPLEGEGRGEGALGASNSGSQLFYTARVTLDRTTINVDGPSSEARGAKEAKPVKSEPGMQASVEIETGKRKLIEFLLSPLMRMRDEAGRER